MPPNLAELNDICYDVIIHYRMVYCKEIRELMGKRGYGIIRTELTHMDRGRARMLKDMLASFRDVSAFLIHVACDNAPDILTLSSFNQLTAMERLVHRTKDNPSPAYVQFDKLFPRYPSYMRRSAIHFAVGHVQSHETRCDAYYEYRDALVSRRRHVKRMAPGFTYTPNACPTMYRKESLKVNQGTVDLKVLRRGQWVWETFTLAARDYKSLQKASLCGDVKNPKLVHEYGKFYLEFPVKYRTKQYPDLPLDRQLAIGCDLGLTNGAVLSAVDSRGSVHGRWFSPFKGDMARIDHTINLIRKYAALSGKGQSLAALYTKLEGLKDNYVKQLSRWIVNRAIDAGAYCIVLEHLGRMRGRGALAARTHHWCTARIRDYVQGMAARKGIRVFIVNPRGTSMFAYDGSGPVKRDEHNYSLCTFASGKRYNCDLSASYNIAARYFLRAARKSMPAKVWSESGVKVPGLSKGTTWTLATLRALSEAAAS